MITIGTSGAVSYQRFAHDDLFAMVHDNEPEATQLLAEGRFDMGMFASEGHPLLRARDRPDIDWLVTSGKRRKKHKHG
ncbi:MAG: hypothetical protein H7Z43_02115 [Clostridia bacterium]|nr:hypothetical protein [Deltaproteobacteria bacterium]